MKETKQMTMNAIAGDLMQLVSFRVGEEEFGVDIMKVQEINRMNLVAPVPNAPQYVSGIMNLRGKVIPIIDLRQRFHRGKQEQDKETRIIVVELRSRIIGFVVDAVNEVLRIPQSVTEPPPPMVSGIECEYITAICKLDDRLLILIDLEKILPIDAGQETIHVAEEQQCVIQKTPNNQLTSHH